MFKRIRFRKKKEMPPGLFLRCAGCGNMQYKQDVETGLQVCPECNYHFEISSADRIRQILDEGSFAEMWTDLTPLDPLSFKAKKAYKDRLLASQKATGLKDACVVGVGRIEGRQVAFGATDPHFMRGSMGSVVGEKITRIAELAAERKLPLVFVSGSGGGARMDEGAISLMQMAKTSAALARLDDGGGLFISVLTNPTMGGCMASFAALGDIIIAEPKALLGFAGPRVIRDTIREELPAGFQTSEFLLDHGFLDMIVSRGDLRLKLDQLIGYCLGGNGDGGEASKTATEDV
jgi:acetyl-CoA carboxylase carboxyl transferase subunit beta